MCWKRLPILLIAGIAFFASAENQETNEIEGKWGFSVTLMNSGIDDDVANLQGIDSSAIILGFQASYLKEDWLTTLGLDLVEYSDNNSFSQTVEGTGYYNRGDISNASSEASGIMLNGAFGKLWDFGDNKNIITFAQGGFSIMTSSERSIPDCDDCATESIDVNGGLFIKGGLMKRFDSFSLGLEAKHYVSGDLGTQIGLILSSNFD